MEFHAIRATRKGGTSLFYKPLGTIIYWYINSCCANDTIKGSVVETGFRPLSRYIRLRRSPSQQPRVNKTVLQNQVL